MQTQWSNGASDGHGGGTAGGATTEETRAADALGTASRDGGVSPVDGPTAEAVDGGEGEEEAHRSAVDAVDELLDEVELALARLDDGTYGRCEECGSPIDDARLAGSPIVCTCGACVIGDSREADALVATPGPTGTWVPVGAVASSPGSAGLTATTGPDGD
jgi:RNA polymerase-binding transcription factor DksA